MVWWRTIPVVAVMGTSSVQGKHTLQLQLRKYFIDCGYKVGQIGSEPLAQLFDMDEVVPYGFNAFVNLYEKDFIKYINFLLYNISRKDPDIIIGGTQSGTVPKYMFNTSLLNIKSLEYAIGLNPDIVILCVNIYDEIEYIRRSVQTIESLVECRVLAIAISPLIFKTHWNQVNNRKSPAGLEDIEHFRIMVEEQLKIKAYMIGTEEIKELVSCCIDFLAGDDL